MSRQKLMLMVFLAVPACGQDNPFLAENFNVSGQFGALLAKLENSAACKQALVQRSEFETSPEFARRREEYVRNSIQLLRDAVASYNAHESREVMISFALRQGSYNADAGVYSLLARQNVVLDYGFSMAENKPYVRLRVETPWNKVYLLSVGSIDFQVDSTAARRLRSRESQMRVVVCFRLKAVAGGPRADADYGTPLGLAFLPYKTEVRDPAENSPVIWSRDLTEGEADIWNLHNWRIVEGQRCGVN